MTTPSLPRAETDVLIVGAGPTGLTLAAQLHALGARFRLVDRAPDQVHESRALAVQARTLEVLDTLGLAEPLVARGNPGARLRLHTRPDEIVDVGFALDPSVGTRWPFILMVSQAETEALLAEYLASHGVVIERGMTAERVDTDGDAARCTLRHADGRAEDVRARWIVGCDGAHSVVRKSTGVAFEGGAYPQHYLLGDVEIDGLHDDHAALHAFPAGRGVALCFPMRAPRSWRVIVIPGPEDRAHPSDTDARPQQPLSLGELQTAFDAAAGAGFTLRDPAWLTHFRLHHRQAAHYRAGPVFLAGDAAHIHSPVGAQGMNTGIQDAWNLGWRLALVARGDAVPALLDAYEAERWPVGRTLLRSTDRAFALVTRGAAGGALATAVRRALVRHVVPRVIGSERVRENVFHFASQLGIRNRESPAVQEGEPSLGTGPRAGDRLPDAPLVGGGEHAWLQRLAVGPRLTLLLCGDDANGDWDERALDTVGTGRESVMLVRRVPGAERVALERLGVDAARGAQYLVRPDGHIAFRCAGRDLGAVRAYLDRWHPARARRSIDA